MSPSASAPPTSAASSAALLELAGGAQEGAVGDAREHATDADALDADGAELRDREAAAGEDVDRLRDSAANGFDRIERRQTGRIEHVGAGLLEGLEALDGVVEVLPAMQEILGARRQGEGEGELPRRLDRGGDAFRRVAEIIDRL